MDWYGILPNVLKFKPRPTIMNNFRLENHFEKRNYSTGQKARTRPHPELEDRRVWKYFQRLFEQYPKAFEIMKKFSANKFNEHAPDAEESNLDQFHENFRDNDFTKKQPPYNNNVTAYNNKVDDDTVEYDTDSEDSFYSVRTSFSCKKDDDGGGQEVSSDDPLILLENLGENIKTLTSPRIRRPESMEIFSTIV